MSRGYVITGIERVSNFLRTFPGRLISHEKRIRHKALADFRDDVKQGIKQQDIYDTGDYYRDVKIRGDAVSTTRPDAPRHEFGFIGTDSLDRTYHIAPRAHWRPAIARLRVNYPAAITKEIRSLVDEG